MGYQALLFCPDEKTARTVTQVLSELEFGVVACTEPFAAVKKLMSDHFDALVVDCDNEQNATLLFKSARNSASNQTSLAVAVVEGQAGVAKAFRFGANLVLTKPINVEQAKGTLRVARGLLRKGEPAKPAAPSAPAPASTPPIAVAPAKPAVPMPTAKPAAPRPAVPVTAKLGPSSLPPKPVSAGAPPVAKAPVAAQPGMSNAVASNTANDDDLLDLGAEDSVGTPAVAKDGRTPQPSKLPLRVPAAPAASESKPSPMVASANSFGSGAASAPAPALEQSHAVEAISATQADDILDNPAKAVASESHSSAGPMTTFTFGGAAIEKESSGGSKKVLLAVAAVAVVAVGGYFGWNYFQSRANQSAAAVSHPVQPAQPTATPAAKPFASQPAPVQTAPATSSPVPASSQDGTSSVNPSSASKAADSDDSANDDASAAPANPKKAAAASASAAKPEATNPAPAPLVVKGGHVSTSKKPASGASADAPAPAVLGIAVPGSSAPPLNLVGGNSTATKPLLEKLNVSQGVSQGLLIKKVSPVYPKSALTMRLEGAVELLATISKNGDITAVKVLSGEGQLAKAASDAVKQWKYKPYLLNGEPVEIQTQVTINFRLPK